MDTDFEKYTYEVFPIECDFSKNMATNETITLASSDIKIHDADGNDKTGTMLVSASKSVSGQKLLGKVQAGTADTKYTIKFKIVTSANNKFQKDMSLYVEYE